MATNEVKNETAIEAKPKVTTPEELVDPRVQAMVNERLNATVKEIFAGLAPILKDVLEKTALTPEKMAQMEEIRRAPSQSQVARELRDRKRMQADEEERLATIARKQEACSHRYPTGTYSCSTTHNYPDRMPRIVCVICHALFAPTHWRIDADPTDPKGKAVLVAAHPRYQEILNAVESQQGVGRL